MTYDPTRSWAIALTNITIPNNNGHYIYLKVPVEEGITTSEVIVSEYHVDPLRDDGFVIYKMGYAHPVAGGAREVSLLWGNVKTPGVPYLGANKDVNLGTWKIIANQLQSVVATGTAPLIVASTTLVANLNADLLDGYHAAAFCLTGDLRLSDSRPASDVYPWAKASVKPSYTYAEVGAAPLAHKTIEDAINGLVKVNGSGGYSAVTDNSSNWNSAYTRMGTVLLGSNYVGVNSGDFGQNATDLTINKVDFAAEGNTYPITSDGVFYELGAKQATLVSGVNIKTINGSSILGSGNLIVAPSAHNIQSHSDVYIPVTLDAGYSGQMFYWTGTAWGIGSKSTLGLQSTLVSGTNIKTVNGNSLLGSGDVTISGSAAWGGITGTLSSQTDLNTALNGKAALAGSSSQAFATAALTANGNVSGTQFLLANGTAYGGVWASGAIVRMGALSASTQVELYVNGSLNATFTTSLAAFGGTIKASQFQVSSMNSAPATATATGTLGEIRITATYIYVCTATNTWKRVAIATW
jgi:hypothetical protein